MSRGGRAAPVDAGRLADLLRRLGSLEEREHLLVRLREDHNRAVDGFERGLCIPASPGAEADRRTVLRNEIWTLSDDAVNDGIDAELSDLEAERQDLFCRMSEEGMREGLWTRHPLKRRTGVMLHGRASSHSLHEAPWRAARIAPEHLPPQEVLGCARLVRERLFSNLRLVSCSLVVLLLWFAAFAIVQPHSPPETALGRVIWEWVFPLSALPALLALVLELLLFVPLSLYEFCRLGALMRRRADLYPEPLPDSYVRGDPSVHGGPHDGSLTNDDPN